MTTCPSIGDLLVGGRKVGLLHCTLEAGHELSEPDDPLPYNGTPHQAVLERRDEPTLAQSWPDALDLDEQFDVDVDITTPDPLPDDGQG